MNLRTQTESIFEKWSELVVSHRWLALIFAIGISLIIIPQIRHGWVDVSVESYLPHGNPTMVDYDEFRQEFDYTMGAFLAIKTSNGIFNLDTLKKIKALHDELEADTPYMQKITSIVNVRQTHADHDTLAVDDLFEFWPETESDMPAFKKLVMSNPNYVKALVSADGLSTSILLEHHLYSSVGHEELNVLDGFDSKDTSDNNALVYLSSDEEKKFSEAVYRIVEKYSSDDFIIYAAGAPLMNYILTIDMETSTYRATALGFLIIIILLAFLFRRVSGVVMPLLVVFLSLASTLALWPVLGFAFNGNTQILPTFILAVGIADSVHILSIFYKHYDNGKSKHDAIILSMKQTAIAILMTTITTAASLLSFLAAEMVPTKTMGIFGAIGVVIALFYTLVLLPSLLAILPIKRKTQNLDKKPSYTLKKIDHMIYACGNLGVNYARPLVIFTALLSVIAIAGVFKTSFSQDPVRWYGEDAHLRQSVEYIDKNSDGTMAVQILIETDKTNAIHDPKLLHAIEDIELKAKQYRYKDVQASNAVSILSVIKETHQALNNNDPSAFKIPDDKQAIAQEMLLFENSGADDIYDFTNSNFSVARIDIIIPWSNVINYHNYISGLDKLVNEVVEEHQLEGVTVKSVGLLKMMSETILSMMRGTVESYLLAFALVALLMIVLMEDVRRGLLAFSPNITPILFTVGLMGLFSHPLNIFSSMLGCVIIGISVDDTIHFMHHFRRYAQESDDIKEVIHKTLETCGRAITFTSIVLIGGFIVHLSGVFTVNHEFGYLLSFAIFLALFANLILAPALMTLFWHKKTNAES